MQNLWGFNDKNVHIDRVLSTEVYGTTRTDALEIMLSTLNMKDVKIYDIDSKGNHKLNYRETVLAQEKQKKIKREFGEWIWDNSARRAEIVEIYNNNFNSIRPRVYDGSNLRFEGMNPEIKLKAHQKDAIARILYGGNTLLAHEVGLGKTFEIIAAAMESKRLGLCNKSLITVPKHLT